MSGRLKLAASFSILFLACSGIASAQQQVIGAPPEALNMKLVGTNDLQARSGYQPTIHHQGDRWIAYIGHHGGSDDIPAPVNPQTGKAEPNGTSIVDVTDPAQPRYLRHLPGQEGKYESGGAQMVRICDGKALPKGDRNAVYMLRTFGGEAHEIWNVADPANPVLITRIAGLKDTHKNWWECDTGIAFLVSGAPDWRTRRMTQVYDLSDPAHPQKIRDFGLPGQEPGSTGAVPTELHGPISTGLPATGSISATAPTRAASCRSSIARNCSMARRSRPRTICVRRKSRGWRCRRSTAPTRRFRCRACRSRNSPRDKDGKTRDIVMIVDEAILNECNEPRQMVWFADITVENRPMMISSYTVPEASGSFCERGGRFGAHSSNESMAPVYYKKMAFISFFNAGVRALDIRDPYHPTEVGYFIPAITAATDKRCVKIDGKDRCKVAIQTNNVETDERGYVYIVDRANTGLHILELTGPARAVAGIQ